MLCLGVNGAFSRGPEGESQGASAGVQAAPSMPGPPDAAPQAATHAEAAAPRPRSGRQSPASAGGLCWQDLGHTAPVPGTEILCDGLAAALRHTVVFTRQELLSLGVPRLSGDSYIKVADRYFKPVVATASRPLSAALHGSPLPTPHAADGAGGSRGGGVAEGAAGSGGALARLERAAVLAEAADRLQVAALPCLAWPSRPNPLPLPLPLPACLLAGGRAGGQGGIRAAFSLAQRAVAAFRGCWRPASCSPRSIVVHCVVSCMASLPPSLRLRRCLTLI